jgi:hypothetical protein
MVMETEKVQKNRTKGQKGKREKKEKDGRVVVDYKLAD